MKILIIIPAYNEENTINSVIMQIQAHFSQADILVIDDGSRDRTYLKALHAGAKAVSLPFNLGIGGAVQTGYLYAKKNGYDIAVQVDGDGQHDPRYINSLVEPVMKDVCDICIGSRFLSQTDYKPSFFRKLGIIFFSGLVKILTGEKITDTTSGFRAANRKLIEYFSDCYPADYPEVDVLVRLHKRNFRMMEIPVEMRIRQGGRSSITFLRSIYYMIKVSLSLVMGVMKSG